MQIDFSFGIELEQFLFREDGKVPSRSDSDKLFRQIAETGDVLEREGDSILIVRLNFADGAVLIKNESVTHIIEYIFPPLTTIEGFTALFTRTSELMNGIYQDLGLKIMLGAILNSAPENKVIRTSSADAKRVNLEWPVPNHPLALHDFWFSSAATHIHFDIKLEEYFERLPHLFAQEYLVPKDFSRSTSFLNQKAHCIRPIAYHHNFFDNYLLFGMPPNLPSSADELEIMKEESVNFVRDYSFIAYRPEFGTVEFRSADALNELDEIVDLLKLRLEIFETKLEQDYGESRKMFFDTCWGN